MNIIEKLYDNGYVVVAVTTDLGPSNAGIWSLFNVGVQDIEKSTWPDALKAAEVVPIYKSGKKLVVNNYRPISLISNIAKIFEKVIYERIFYFTYKHKILSEKQFGFIKNKGTRDALSYITKRIYENT